MSGSVVRSRTRSSVTMSVDELLKRERYISHEEPTPNENGTYPLDASVKMHFSKMMCERVVSTDDGYQYLYRYEERPRILHGMERHSPFVLIGLVFSRLKRTMFELKLSFDAKHRGGPASRREFSQKQFVKAESFRVLVCMVESVIKTNTEEMQKWFTNGVLVECLDVLHELSYYALVCTNQILLYVATGYIRYLDRLKRMIVLVNSMKAKLSDVYRRAWELLVLVDADLKKRIRPTARDASLYTDFFKLYHKSPRTPVEYVESGELEEGEIEEPRDVELEEPADVELEEPDDVELEAPDDRDPWTSYDDEYPAFDYAHLYAEYLKGSP